MPLKYNKLKVNTPYKKINETTRHRPTDTTIYRTRHFNSIKILSRLPYKESNTKP